MDCYVLKQKKRLPCLGDSKTLASLLYIWTVGIKFGLVYL